jgi:hypothetical protein
LTLPEPSVIVLYPTQLYVVDRVRGLLDGLLQQKTHTDCLKGMENFIKSRLSQLRLGDNDRGFESVRGGLTLFARATADNKYRGYNGWDPADRVKIAGAPSGLHRPQGA